MMENIGLGATLGFESGPAMAGMERAGHGIERLGGSFDRFKEKIRTVGERLDHFNLLAMGIGALGFAGVEGFFHHAIEARSEVEDMEIVLATTLKNTNSSIKEMGDFSYAAGTAMAIARDQMEEIEVAAAGTPGKARDLLDIYKQIAGPMQAAGQSLNQILDMSTGATIAAKALGIPYQDMAFSMDKLISGQVRAQDTLFRMMRSQKLIKEDAAAWAALDPHTRLKKVNALMEKYRANATLISGTWSAMITSIQSIVHMLSESFIKPVFDEIKGSVGGILEMFLGSPAMRAEDRKIIVRHWKESFEEAGKKLVPVFKFVVDVITQVWQNAKHAWEWFSALYVRMRAFFPAGEGFRNIAVHAGAIGIALAGLLPMLSLFRLVIGPVAAILGAVVSGIGLVGTAVTSLGGIIAGTLGFIFSGPGVIVLTLFGALAGALSLLRHENESWGDAAARVWEDSILPGWESLKIWIDDVWTNYLSPFITNFQKGFGVFIPGILSNLQDAWFNLKQAVSLLFDSLSDNLGSNQKDMAEYGNDTGAIIGGIVEFVTSLIRTVSGLMGTVIYVIANIKYAFESVSTAISTFFFNAVVGVTNLFKGLENAITAPIRAVLIFLADMMAKLNQSGMVRKAASAVGINLGAEAESFRKMTVGNGWASKSQYADAAKYDYGESPEDAYFRKRRDGDPMKKRAAENKPMSFEAEIIDRSHRCADVNLKVNMDGSAISAAQARQQVELNERAGAQDTPYQRRAVAMRSDLGMARR